MVSAVASPRAVILAARMACLLAVAVCGNVAGQPATQIQFTYDAAGNLIQATRVVKPDLTVTNLSVGAIGVQTSGAYTIPVSFQVNNVGTGEATGNWTDRGYLSPNALFEDSDEALAGFTTRSAALGAGASYTVNATYTTAATTPAGTYTLHVKADGGAGTGQYAPTGPNVVAEFIETNNVVSAAIVLPPKLPDLAISNASVGAITASQAGAYNLPVTFTVTNAGPTTAQPNFYALAYLSADGTLDNADANLAGYALRNTALAAGASYAVTQTFTTTAATLPGNYTLFVKIDGRSATVGPGTNTDGGFVVEGNEANNAQALALTLPAKPDLTVSNTSVGTLVANQDGSIAISGTVTVTNSGGLAAQPSWWDLAYLSANGVLDNADVNLTGYRNNTAALAAGASYTVPFTYIAPATVASGTYTFFLKADGRGSAVGQGSNADNGKLVEANEANNAQGIALTIPARPDLVVSNVTVGTIVKNANNSKSIPVTFTVTNAGGLATQPTWYDLAYLSIDGVLDNADLNLTGYRTNSAVLAPGASYTATVTFTTPTSTAAGSYTLFIKTDGRGAAIGQGTNTDSGKVVESNELNNVMAIPVVLP